MKKILNSKKVREALDRLIKEITWNNKTGKQLFDSLDQDRDGMLSKPEITKGLRGMGVTLRAIEIDMVLKCFDVDGNGSVDFNEFFDLLEEYAGRKDLGSGRHAHETDLICGFQKGSRVTCLVHLPSRRRTDVRALGHELAASSKGATVIGYGLKPGTVLVRLDSNNEEWTLKPNFLIPMNPDPPQIEPGSPTLPVSPTGRRVQKSESASTLPACRGRERRDSIDSG